jgi:hypothetical protein
LLKENFPVSLADVNTPRIQVGVDLVWVLLGTQLQQQGLMMRCRSALMVC